MTRHERAEIADNDAPEPENEQLRPALELAFAIAVAGQRLKPPISAPQPLKRFLNFQKLPKTALPIIRRVVEQDVAFRQRIAKVATPELAGELGAVWLAQADGWQTRLAELSAEAAQATDREDRARDDRASVRRASLNEEKITTARADLAAAFADLERERARRLEADDRAASATRATIAGQQTNQQISAELVRLKEHLATAQTRIEQLVGERDALGVELKAAGEVRDRALAESTQLSQRLADLERVAAEQRQPAPLGRAPLKLNLNEPSPAAAPLRSSALDDASLALGETAAALRHLASALDRTSAAVRPLPPSAAREQPSHADRDAGPPAATLAQTVAASRRAPGDVNFAPAGAAGHSRSLARSKPDASKRTPLPIPGGLVSDSFAVAEHLLRATTALVVVDGYNVAKLGWPGFALADQRDRLLDGLEDLVRRLGTSVLVVFDGAGVPGVSSGRRLVRVRFSSPGISADQEIIALVVDGPAEQSMIVVTNDREILRGVRTAGANTLSSDQLLEVLRR